MTCYVCSEMPGPGGTRYGVRSAVGICHACGIGLGAAHAHRGALPGLPLLCPDHAIHEHEPRVADASAATRGMRG